MVGHSRPNLTQGRKQCTCMTESAWAKMDLWQSPKSSPQILRFLSAEPLARRVPSEEMSMDKTGSLCPYRAMKNFMVSVKYTCTMHASFGQPRCLEPSRTRRDTATSVHGNIPALPGTRGNDIAVLNTCGLLQGDANGDLKHTANQFALVQGREA